MDREKPSHNDIYLFTASIILCHNKTAQELPNNVLKVTCEYCVPSLQMAKYTYKNLPLGYNT